MEGLEKVQDLLALVSSCLAVHRSGACKPSYLSCIADPRNACGAFNYHGMDTNMSVQRVQNILCRWYVYVDPLIHCHRASKRTVAGVFMKKAV